MTDTSAADLRRALEESRATQARLASENTNLRGRVHSESSARFFAEETAVDNAIAAITNEANALESEHVAAMNEARFAEAAKAQRKLAEAAARLTTYEQRKQWFTAQRERAASEPPPQAQGDPFDQFVGSFDERVRPWIREHRRFYDDPTYRSYVMGAANIAAAKGLTPGTHDYYRFVEERAAEDMDEGEDGGGASTLPRRSQSAPTRQRASTTLSPDEASAALALARALDPKDDKGNPISSEADIYKWYYDRNNSSSAIRRREKWYGAS